MNKGQDEEGYLLHDKGALSPSPSSACLCTFPGHWVLMKGEMIVK